jgi:hypothetical protein
MHVLVGLIDDLTGYPISPIPFRTGLILMDAKSLWSVGMGLLPFANALVGTLFDPSPCMLWP